MARSLILLVLLGEAFFTFQKVTSRLGIIGAPKKLPLISLRKKCWLNTGFFNLLRLD